MCKEIGLTVPELHLFKLYFEEFFDTWAPISHSQTDWCQVEHVIVFEFGMILYILSYSDSTLLFWLIALI